MRIAARPALLGIVALMLVTACGLAAQGDEALLSSAASFHAKMRVEASSPLRAAVEQQPSCLGAGCHEDPASTIALSIHAPYKGGQCSFCHGTDPHGASVSLSARDSIVLCFACHAAASLQASHRMGVGGTDPRNGTPVTCLTCHPPHASDHPHRLNMDPGPALCNQCHSDSMPNP